MDKISEFVNIYWQLYRSLDCVTTSMLQELILKVPKAKNDKTYPLLMTEETRAAHGSSDYLFQKVDGGVSPSSPAEAFIWKQGDYQKYLKFLAYLQGDEIVGNSIVHKAFADHLRNPLDTPIFDQHVCRSIWVLINFKNPSVSEVFEPVLLDSNGNWRAAPRADKVPDEFYEFLKGHINQPYYYLFDSLLMKLGRITKQLTKNKSDESRLLYQKFLKSTEKHRLDRVS